MITPNLLLRNENRMTLDFTQSGSAPSILTAMGAVFTRAQTRYRWNADGSLTNLASGEMPITYTPGYGWGYKADGGLQARWTNSNNPSVASWIKTGYTLSGATETAPDTALLSYFMAETATDAVHEITRTQSVTSAAGIVYHAIFRPVGRRYFAVVFKTTNSAFTGATVVFDTQTVSVVSPVAEYNAAIFQRGSYFEIYVLATGNASATGTVAFVGCDDAGVPSTTTTYMGDVNKGFYWFNIQNLNGRLMPPVVVTTASTTTLTSDVLKVPKSAIAWLNHDNFTMKAVFTMLPFNGGTAVVRIAMVSNPGFTDYKQLYLNLGSGNVIAGIAAASVTNSVSAAILLSGKAGASAAFGRGRGSVSGGDTVTQMAHNLIGDTDGLYIGGSPAGGNPFGNLIQSVTVYRSALRPAQLIRTARSVS